MLWFIHCPCKTLVQNWDDRIQRKYLSAVLTCVDRCVKFCRQLIIYLTEAMMPSRGFYFGETLAWNHMGRFHSNIWTSWYPELSEAQVLLLEVQVIPAQVLQGPCFLQKHLTFHLYCAFLFKHSQWEQHTNEFCALISFCFSYFVCPKNFFLSWLCLISLKTYFLQVKPFERLLYHQTW